MTVLFGHPTGNPNSHHAALAHFEAGWLEAFCVPWMPSKTTLAWLKILSGHSQSVARLSRRNFEQLRNAPTRQGRAGEVRRLALRALGRRDEGLAYEANDWLMRTMAREVARSPVNAVHSYEDCSLWQFQEAKRRGKACLYDMPIGYYPAWQRLEAELTRKYSDWLPNVMSQPRYVRPEQKNSEMDLSDLVLVPSSFVQATVKEYFPNKPIALAPYGVNTEFWTPRDKPKEAGPLVFICAGQISIRKGIPDLLWAWSKAELKDAQLHLVGSWKLSDRQRRDIPSGVQLFAPCSPHRLRDHFHVADVFVLPSYFEGFALVLGEAMACGLPAIATNASGMADIFTGAEGVLLQPGDLDALIAALRWASENRDQLPMMGKAARKTIEARTWASYRTHVKSAVAPFV
jgi:starch synthase